MSSSTDRAAKLFQLERKSHLCCRRLLWLSLHSHPPTNIVSLQSFRKIVGADAFEIEPGNHFLDGFRLPQILRKHARSKHFSFSWRPFVSHSWLADGQWSDSCDDFAIRKRSVPDDQSPAVFVEHIRSVVNVIRNFLLNGGSEHLLNSCSKNPG